MLNLLKRCLPHDFRQRIKRKLLAGQDMTSRLQNLKRAGFSASGAIDGGAYRGSWTKEFWSVWPESPVVIVEPQPAQKERLEALAGRVPGSRLMACALGRECGTVRFRQEESNSGIVDANESAAESLEVPLTTIESLLQQCSGFISNLLKLDLQGGELDALRGAATALERFEVVILEVSIIPIGGVPPFRAVDRFMEDAGYRLYDILPQYYRPLDGALWQCDTLYVRENSNLIASMQWR